MELIGASKENWSAVVPAIEPTVKIVLTKDRSEKTMPEKHWTELDDTQDAEVHPFSLKRTDKERSNAPKFRPDTVTNCEPLNTMLRGPALTVAASKVYPGLMVPMCTPPTVSDRKRSAEEKFGVRHAAELVDVHVAVLHATVLKRNDVVNSIDPKFKPRTVTEASPVEGVLSWLSLKSGASKLKARSLVPVAEWTVIVKVSSCASNGLDRHITEVPVVHVAVLHDARAVTVDAVRSTPPKFRPSTVTEEPPEDGVFTGTKLATGPSKLIWKSAVPTSKATVTVGLSLLPPPVLIKQVSTVLDCHAIVWQNASPSRDEWVKSNSRKASPIKETDIPPDVGRLRSAETEDKTGASKVYASACWVPANAPTVMAVAARLAARESAQRQVADVPEVHELDLHTALASMEVAVRSASPKSIPCTVTELPPVDGEFRSPHESTGASKESSQTEVPTLLPTVTVEDAVSWS